MEQDKRLYVVFIVVGMLTILLSACLGAFAGGIAGYWAGRHTSSQTLKESAPQFPEWQPQPLEPKIEIPGPLRLGCSGALVTEVIEGTPADQAGIQTGDVILAVNGTPIKEQNTLPRLIRKHKPGDKVEITLWSKGSKRTVRVTLSEHPDKEGVAYLGVRCVSLRFMQPETR